MYCFRERRFLLPPSPAKVSDTPGGCFPMGQAWGLERPVPSARYSSFPPLNLNSSLIPIYNQHHNRMYHIPCEFKIPCEIRISCGCITDFQSSVSRSLTSYYCGELTFGK